VGVEINNNNIIVIIKIINIYFLKDEQDDKKILLIKEKIYISEERIVRIGLLSIKPNKITQIKDIFVKQLDTKYPKDVEIKFLELNQVII
jgi:hypothetical protein